MFCAFLLADPGKAGLVWDACRPLRTCWYVKAFARGGSSRRPLPGLDDDDQNQVLQLSIVMGLWHQMSCVHQRVVQERWRRGRIVLSLAHWQDRNANSAAFQNLAGLLVSWHAPCVLALQPSLPTPGRAIIFPAPVPPFCLFQGPCRAVHSRAMGVALKKVVVH